MNDNPNDVSSIRSRIVAMVPADQLPFADFELRMLAATIETEHLRDIHTNWRPIADERNLLREKLAKPAESESEGSAGGRRGARTKAELIQKQYDDLLKKHMDLQDAIKDASGGEGDSVRLKALEVEHQTLKNNHTGLRERHQKLHEDYSELEAKYKKLQVDCGEVEPS